MTLCQRICSVNHHYIFMEHISTMIFIKRIILIASYLALASSDDGYTGGKTCLMDSVCPITVGNVTRNAPCFYEHEPLDDSILNHNFQEFLMSYCPHLLDEEQDLKDMICCSPDMKNSMSLLYKLNIVDNVCPACATNAKKYFCDLLCSPNQNQMVAIDTTKYRAVTRVSYYVSNTFAETFFESCFDVKLFGNYLMHSEYICGTHGRQGCDPYRFLTTLGSYEAMPMTIVPVLVYNETTVYGQTYRPMDSEAYQCNDSGTEQYCSCEHCHQSCPNNGISVSVTMHTIFSICTLLIVMLFLL